MKRKMIMPIAHHMTMPMSSPSRTPRVGAKASLSWISGASSTTAAVGFRSSAMRALSVNLIRPGRRRSVTDGRGDTVGDFVSISESSIGLPVGLAAALAKQVRVSPTSGWLQSSYAIRAIRHKFVWVRIRSGNPARSTTQRRRPSHNGSSSQSEPGMPSPSTLLLPELPESQATGELERIYDEVRRFSGVPYVSSLQRYLATLPGVLEWAWAALRPAMAPGVIPETGWRLAAEVRATPAASVSPSMLREWGVDDAGLAAVRNIAANFVRVSPVNLVTGACLRRLLSGVAPSGVGLAGTWTPPAMLPAMPGNVDPAALPEVQRAVLMRFATEVDGVPFIPALYRQVAHWPRVLSWLAD